jgi:hypothetical protein
MMLRTSLVAAAFGAAVATGGTAALAQQSPYQQGPYDQGQYQQAPYQQGPYQQGPYEQGTYGQGGAYGPAPYTAPYRARYHHGIAAVIRSEMSAGRISKSEGAFLLKKIRVLHQERRAEHEARYNEYGPQPGMQGQPQPR